MEHGKKGSTREPKRVKLTKGRIDAFVCPSGKAQAFLWDTDAPGMGVRATPGSEKRAFIFQFRLNGKTPRLTIGDVRVWGIEESRDERTGEVLVAGARQEARRLQALVDQGIDPRDEKEDRRIEAETKKAAKAHRETTFGMAWAVYVEKSASAWSALYRKDHARAVLPGGLPRHNRGRGEGQSKVTMPGMIYPLAALRLVDLSSAVLNDWMTANNARGKTSAAKTFRMVRAFLKWCDERDEYKGLFDVRSCLTREVRSKVAQSQAKSDVLQRSHLRPWFEKVREIGSPVTSAYLQVALLIGARPNEVATLRWESIGFKWGQLAIADNTVDAREIPLTPYVASLLRDLKARNDTPPPSHRILRGQKIKNDTENWKPSPWVFPSKTSKTGHIESPNFALNQVQVSAGLPELSVHGLRRSFKSLTEWCEVPVGIVAQIMGHKPSATAEKHYTVRPVELLALWHQKIEAWILEQAGITFQADAPALQVVQNAAA